MDIKRPRVFIVKIPEKYQDGTWVPKLSPVEAERFGTVKLILGSGRKLTVEDTPIIKAALDDFTTDDFLVLMGSPLQIGLATHFAMERTDGKVTFLIWDHYIKDYKMQEIDCND